MSLKVGDKVDGVSFEGHDIIGYSTEMNKYIGKTGNVQTVHDRICSVVFDDGEFWWYPIEVLKVVETKKEKVMSDIKIAAYAVVNTKTSEIVNLEYTREMARHSLQTHKSHLRDSFKIVKLKPDGFIR